MGGGGGGGGFICGSDFVYNKDELFLFLFFYDESLLMVLDKIWQFYFSIGIFLLLKIEVLYHLVDGMIWPLSAAFMIR